MTDPRSSKAPCSECGIQHSGVASCGAANACSTCSGDGKVVPYGSVTDIPESEANTCPACEGTGDTLRYRQWQAAKRTSEGIHAYIERTDAEERTAAAEHEAHRVARAGSSPYRAPDPRPNEAPPEPWGPGCHCDPDCASELEHALATSQCTCHLHPQTPTWQCPVHALLPMAKRRIAQRTQDTKIAETRIAELEHEVAANKIQIQMLETLRCRCREPRSDNATIARTEELRALRQRIASQRIELARLNKAAVEYWKVLRERERRVDYPLTQALAGDLAGIAKRVIAESLGDLDDQGCLELAHRSWDVGEIAAHVADEVERAIFEKCRASDSVMTPEKKT